ncbi:hypothetical protein ASE98_02225 [Pseudomonas sp. Leaf48]|nr:hypothetical protein ASE98_02225 [Pseudomonas sp. Leaf48]
MICNGINKVEGLAQIKKIGIRHTLVVSTDMRCIGGAQKYLSRANRANNLRHETSGFLGVN